VLRRWLARNKVRNLVPIDRSDSEPRHLTGQPVDDLGRGTNPSNGHHQRMSVSVVACPRNHFCYNSLTVPV
jgi:hypothetical protein